MRVRYNFGYFDDFIIYRFDQPIRFRLDRAKGDRVPGQSRRALRSKIRSGRQRAFDYLFVSYFDTIVDHISRRNARY